MGLIDTNQPEDQLTSFALGHSYAVTGRSLVALALSTEDSTTRRLQHGVGGDSRCDGAAVVVKEFPRSVLTICSRFVLMVPPDLEAPMDNRITTNYGVKSIPCVRICWTWKRPSATGSSRTRTARDPRAPDGDAAGPDRPCAGNGCGSAAQTDCRQSRNGCGKTIGRSRDLSRCPKPKIQKRRLATRR